MKGMIVLVAVIACCLVGVMAKEEMLNCPGTTGAGKEKKKEKKRKMKISPKNRD